jgi:hypothetical protein
MRLVVGKIKNSFRCPQREKWEWLSKPRWMPTQNTPANSLILEEHEANIGKTI